MNSSSSNISILGMLDASYWVNALRCVISLNSMLTNALLLFLFLRFRSLRKFQCNWLIALTATVEMIIGFGMGLRGVFQLYVAANGISQFSHSLCVWIGSPFTGGFAANQITILALAIDRVRAVIQPTKFSSKNASFLTVTVSLTICIFAGAIWVSLYQIDDTVPSSQCSMGTNAGQWFSMVWAFYSQSSTLVVFALYITLLILLYVKTKSFVNQPVCQHKPDLVIEQHQITQQNRLTNSIVLILALYSICWALPTAVWFIFNLLDATNKMRINYVTFYLGYITPFGAGLNLYIYLVKHTEIRNCALKTLPFLKSILGDQNSTEVQFLQVQCQPHQQQIGLDRRTSTMARIE